MENEDFGERAAMMKNTKAALLQYEKGFVLWAGWDVDQAVAYVKDNDLTNDDVKILKFKNDQVIVKRK